MNIINKCVIHLKMVQIVLISNPFYDKKYDNFKLYTLFIHVTT